jgi:hypothetical protein
VRTRPLALVALLAAVSSLGLVGPVSPVVAAPAGSVTTDGWTWEVLTGENDLFGDVTPPSVSAVAGVTIDSSTPTLRAPSIPMLYSFLADTRWTYGTVVITQPVPNGPVTVTAILSGPGGTVDVTAEVEGGSVEYTLEWSTSLSSLVGVDHDPFVDGYTDGELVYETDGVAITTFGGWLAGSSTHHSAAWGLDQLDSDPLGDWVVFLQVADAPVDVLEPALAPAAAAPLSRALIFSDGPSGFETPADTWIVRVALSGGAGCASDTTALQSLATTLASGRASGSTATGTGCLSAGPVTGTSGEPLDLLLPIELDPALAATAWWADRDNLALRIGDLPTGLTAGLEINGGDPAVRIQGVPESAGDVTVPIVLGGESGVSSPELVDAVGGEIDFSIAPALAATGVEVPASALVAGSVALLVLGAGLVRVAGARRARNG